MTHCYKNLWRGMLAGLLALFMSNSVQADTMINGGGATFPYPIYSKWFDEYHKSNPEIRINYQAIGSGGGIRQFIQRTVDFGATDSPMRDRQISKLNGNVYHIPTVLGAVVPAFNVDGVKHLNFTGEVLARIFLGEIRLWNDRAIKALNPDVDLPHRPITVVRRSDGSGTTFCFTDYLSRVSPAWKREVGKAQAVNWPTGIGAKGNEGVAGMVRQSPYSLGYIELVYAKQNKITYGAVQNKAGKFVKADVESVSAAANSVDMPEDYRVSIVNAPGDTSYPISTFTWMLVNKKHNSDTGAHIKGFLEWMLTDGQVFAPELDYAPLPADVKAMVKKTVSTIQ